MIALVPLDGRPCNVRFPQQIARIGGDEICTPPHEILGSFHSPADGEALVQWLENLPPVEALIVSVDLLAYGGLVPSRKPTVSVEEALHRIEAVRAFHRKNPQTPIYAFNILMRLAITMSGDDAVANYYNIMRYARLADEAERFDSAHLRSELESVRAEIPAGVLDEYLAARARNHGVNLQMVDWLADGVFSYLLITQEDATEYGLHRREQDEIMERVRQLNVEAKFSLHPGADEAALTLLARHWQTGVSFRVYASNREDMQRVAPFEDRPYHQALRQHIAAIGGQWLEDGDADFHLFVNAPVGGSQKDESEESREERASRITAFAREIEFAINQTCDVSTHMPSRVALCDVAFPNGADNVLMAELEKRGLLAKLAVFGGWNTAGNTTGTVLAQCAALKKSGSGFRVSGSETPASSPQSSASLNRQFVFERLVDDWFYQSQVRAKIEKSAREQGLSPLNMENEAAPIEALARRELRGFAQLLARRHFKTEIQHSEITLPWGRSFEADVRIDLSAES